MLLLVDPHHLIREAGARILITFGFDVITAPDGLEGVHIFGERQDEIVGVILDYAMPVMDGAEAFRVRRRGADYIPAEALQRA